MKGSSIFRFRLQLIFWPCSCVVYLRFTGSNGKDRDRPLEKKTSWRTEAEVRIGGSDSQTLKSLCSGLENQEKCSWGCWSKFCSVSMYVNIYIYMYTQWNSLYIVTYINIHININIYIHIVCEPRKVFGTSHNRGSVPTSFCNLHIVFSDHPTLLSLHRIKAVTHTHIHITRCICIWENYNNSRTWNKAILGWFLLLTMIPGFGRDVRSL